MTQRDVAKPATSISQALLEAWNKRDFDQLQALTAEDIKWRHTPTDTVGQGRTSFHQMIQAWHTTMPDNQVEVRNTITAGEWEIVEAVGHASHASPLAGPLGNAPGSGRSVDLPFCMIMHIRGGQVDQCSVYLDMSPLMGFGA